MRRLKPIVPDRLRDNSGGISFRLGFDTARLGRLLRRIKLRICRKFHGPLFAFCLHHLGPARPFRIELLQHGIARGLIEVHIEDLRPGNLDPPIIHGILDSFLDIGNQLAAV